MIGKQTRVVCTRDGDVLRAKILGEVDHHGAKDLREEIDGEAYVTRVYCYDGYIRELFTVDGGVYAPEDGEPVLAAQELRFSWDGELVEAVCVDADGQVSRSYFAPRSGEGADPS